MLRRIWTWPCGCMNPPMLEKVAKRSPEAARVARPGMMVW